MDRVLSSRPIFRVDALQNLYLGPLVTEKEIEAKAQEESEKETEEAPKAEEGGEAKDPGKVDPAAIEGGGDDVKGATIALEELSATGRDELTRSESADRAV